MKTSKPTRTSHLIATLLAFNTALNLSHAAENIPPNPPSVFAVIPGDGQVTLRWNDAPGATGYTVRSRGFTVENIQSNEIIHDSARNGASGRYEISSINASGESEATQPIIAKPTAPVLDWIPAGASLEILADGMQFTEGPVWTPSNSGYLVFSDIDGNRLYRWDIENGLSIFREPSHNANGNTIDLEGRLLTCEHANRYISITRHDGTVEPLIQHFDGKKFNSPNDVVVKSDGTIWFTDPTYGMTGKKELSSQDVYRFDPDTQSVERVATGFQQPNGLCFSPDESRLYVADSSTLSQIKVFDVMEGNTLSEGRVFATPLVPDGIRTDSKGRLWSSGWNAVTVYDPDGTLLATIPTPQTSANLAFGGENEDMLFITARTALYGITRKPDLTVLSTTFSATSPTQGDRMGFQTVVTNVGTGSTPEDAEIRLRVEINGGKETLYTDAYIGALPAGGKILFTFPTNGEPAWIAGAGEQQIEMFIESSIAFQESNPRNNRTEYTLNATPKTPEPCEGCTVSFRPTLHAEKIRGTQITETIVSTALADNLIESLTQREVVIMLPPSYFTPSGSNKHYPVIYSLHGFWNSRIDGALRTEAEARWKARIMGEAILVFVDANNRYGGSFYGSSPIIGDYESYITEEIVDFIDEHYRTIQDRSSRALAGYSMGGFGAVRLGFRNHDQFAVVAACSGLYDFSSDWYVNSISRSITGFNGTWTQYEKLSLNEQAAMAIAASASPNPELPPFFTDRVWNQEGRRPVQNPDTLNLHIQFDALRAMDDYKESNPNPMSVGIIHGKSDNIVPISQAQTLHAALQENEAIGITTSYVEVADGHSFRQKEVLDFLGQELAGLEFLLAQPVLSLNRLEDQLEISFATQPGVEYDLQVAASPTQTGKETKWTDALTIIGNDKTAVIHYPTNSETKQTWFRVTANTQNP